MQLRPENSSEREYTFKEMLDKTGESGFGHTDCRVCEGSMFVWIPRTVVRATDKSELSGIESVRVFNRLPCAACFVQSMTRRAAIS